MITHACTTTKPDVFQAGCTAIVILTMPVVSGCGPHVSFRLCSYILREEIDPLASDSYSSTMILHSHAHAQHIKLSRRPHRQWKNIVYVTSLKKNFFLKVKLGYRSSSLSDH